MLLQFKSNNAELYPIRANATDAGIDLKAKQLYVLEANKRTVVGTGVSVQIPVNYVGLLFPRSSLSKKGIMMSNHVGVIDSDYRGEVMASLFYDPKLICSNSLYQEVSQYERIVQLVVLPCALVVPTLNTEPDTVWYDTARGIGSFGSTGTH